VPILAVFFAGRRTNKIHIVAVIPVAHPNTFGAADVPNGEVGDNIQQAFADAHDARGTNWMDATMKFVPAAHIAIVAERVVHTTILHNIVAVGEDRAERLVNGLNALEARINSTTANHVAMSRGGVPEEIDGGMVTANAVDAHHLPAAADAAAASAESKRRTERLTGMMAMFAHLNNDSTASPLS
jgi:hypothetical protein